MDNKTPVDENKVNKKMENLLDLQMDTADAPGTEFKDIPHDNPNHGTQKCSMFKGTMMDFTTIMEALEFIEAFDIFEEDAMGAAIEGEPVDEKEVMEELDKLFTPVLVMQNFENEISDKTTAELESAKVLTERSIIKFDDDARMSQLINVCAELIAKAKNTKAWQLFKQAASLKKKAGLDLQQDEYEAAKELAQKYLVKISTSNPSSIARQAALSLLPKTND